MTVTSESVTVSSQEQDTSSDEIKVAQVDGASSTNPEPPPRQKRMKTKTNITTISVPTKLDGNSSTLKMNGDLEQKLLPRQHMMILNGGSMRGRNLERSRPSPDVRQREPSKLIMDPKGGQMRSSHRRSSSVPSSVFRRPLTPLQTSFYPNMNPYLPPPPLPSLYCSSSIPLSLPYWLQPPGCRQNTQTASPPKSLVYMQRGRARTRSPPPTVYRPQHTPPATLPDPASLRPVIKGGSVSSQDSSGSDSDSKESPTTTTKTPTTKKVVTFNYMTTVQLMDM